MLQKREETHPRFPNDGLAVHRESDAYPALRPGLRGAAPRPAALPRVDDVWMPALRHLGLTRSVIEEASARAARHETSFEEEILAAGIVGEVPFYAAVARSLGLSFLARVDADSLVLRERDDVRLLRNRGGVRVARIDSGDGRTLIAVAPTASDVRRLTVELGRRPALRDRLVVVAPSVLRRAIIRRCEPLLVEGALSGLSRALPECSARATFTPRQSFLVGLSVSAAAAGAIAWPAQALLLVHLGLLAVFIPCIILRLMAARGTRLPAPVFSALRDADLPRYTVLVALHREAAIVPQLLVALGRIEWPRARLEIKLVCEADDAETLNAIRDQRPRPYVEIIEVPPCEPRTKPKALAYALQISSGDFVALYDAEDRPHPKQLKEAWLRFRDGDPALACVQAPLVVSNRSASLISRMFAFEYSGLFSAMLPFLARNRLVLPLGGTSNHFRREALDKIGGWDPYNVTEDADLGLRLQRFGYRTETITLPTLEAGPVGFGVWLPQRTRWFKGWARLGSKDHMILISNDNLTFMAQGYSIVATQ